MNRAIAGRKVESSVWKYYDYVTTTDKCRCLVPDKTGKVCGKEIAGRNCTNLKCHLSSSHPDAYAECISADKDKKSHAAVSKTSAMEKMSDNKKQITIQQTMQNVGRIYLATSVEHISRQNAMLNFVVDSMSPVSLVGHKSFQNFCPTTTKLHKAIMPTNRWHQL